MPVAARARACRCRSARTSRPCRARPGRDAHLVGRRAAPALVGSGRPSGTAWIRSALARPISRIGSSRRRGRLARAGDGPQLGRQLLHAPAGCARSPSRPSAARTGSGAGTRSPAARSAARRRAPSARTPRAISAAGAPPCSARGSHGPRACSVGDEALAVGDEDASLIARRRQSRAAARDERRRSFPDRAAAAPWPKHASAGSQRGQPARGLAVARRVGREDVAAARAGRGCRSCTFMLLSTSPRISTRSDSRQKATWPREWPGRLEHGEAGDLVALAAARARPGGAGPVQKRACKRVDPAAAPCGLLIAPGRLHRRHVVLPAPQRDPQLLADRVAGALVVGVGVGQRVRGDRPAGDLAHDPPLAPGGSPRRSARPRSGTR